MSTERTFKNITVILVILAMVSSLMPDIKVDAATKSTVTVSTQKGLTKALKNKKSKTIKISTGKARSFTIPKGNYSRKTIRVDGKKVTLNNRGTVKSINIQKGKKLVQDGKAGTVISKASNTYLQLNEGSNTKKLYVSGKNTEVDANSKTNIEAGNRMTAVIDDGAEKSQVELYKQGKYSSVINKTQDVVVMDVPSGKIILQPLEMYCETPEDEEVVGWSVGEDGDLALGLDDTRKFLAGNSGDMVTGYYHNKKTKTSFECSYHMIENRIVVVKLNLEEYNRNWLGNAEFEVLSRNGHNVILKSINNVYGDEGQVYDMYFPVADPVDDDNPLKIFSGRTCAYPLTLDIHGSGEWAYMSTKNRAHGWYSNEKTNTDYKCNFVVKGDTIEVKRIKSNRSHKNYRGDAEFRIIDTTANYIVVESSNDRYGDKGDRYVFWAIETEGPVNKDNPLYNFSHYTESENLTLHIDGSGVYSDRSHGDSIHGRYENEDTGTSYECYFIVCGDTIHAVMSISSSNRRYEGNAEFMIVDENRDSITLRSMNNNYGDEGREYTFTKPHEPAQIPETALSDASGYLVCNNVRLHVSSYGTNIWYENSKTGTSYDGHGKYEGNRITIENGSGRGKRYRGDAEFEVVSSDQYTVVLKSMNDNYGDLGEIYTFYK